MITGKSRWLTDCTISRPTPGQLNTVSVTTVPPSSRPRLMPATVTSGSNAFGSM